MGTAQAVWQLYILRFGVAFGCVKFPFFLIKLSFNIILEQFKGVSLSTDFGQYGFKYIPTGIHFVTRLFTSVYIDKLELFPVFAWRSAWFSKLGYLFWLRSQLRK